MCHYRLNHHTPQIILSSTLPQTLTFSSRKRSDTVGEFGTVLKSNWNRAVFEGFESLSSI